MISEDTLEELNSQDWEAESVALLNYVLFLMRYMKVERYFQASDIVSETIERLYTGDRNWDRIKYPQIGPVLRGTAKSVLYSFIKNKMFQHEEINLSILSDEIEDDDQIKANSEEYYILPEEISNNLQKYKDAVSGDKHLELLYECYAAEITSSEEMCQILEISKTELYNLTKRFRRRILKLLQNN